MDQLGMFIFSIFFMFFQVEAQSEDSPDSQDAVSNFQPSLAVVIGILAIMFSITFTLLVYAKLCHRASYVHTQNQGGLVRSRSQLSGIDKAVIESLPFFRFSSLRGSREGLECAVCLSKFEDFEILRLLPKCKHAFHIDCVDQWLEKHSSCPLCRRKVSADDLTFLTYSSSLRYLWDQSSLREDSNLELFVEREEDHHRGSSRFSIGSSFRRFEKGKKEEELLIQENCDTSDDSNQKALHKLNHKIILSDVVLKNRWSSVSSSDLMFLNSEMLNAMSSNRFSSLDSNNDQQLPTARVIEDGHVMKIKEEMERKRVFESKVSMINQSDSLSFLGGLPNTSESNYINPSQPSRIVNPNQKRSMSEITVHPRFTESTMRNGVREPSSLSENNVKEERLRRLWLPIARRTVQWFANREKRNQQSQNTGQLSMNV
ncbi:E3 ubiquitin-protein ligase ATL42-like [Cornus florida]|uniref:E3 ubiquitin-protein ligase ATL42-like n=1 Tax=Cornus florida TaxID=4283 RepID=UPI00289C5066|nr:E3 ubiquitin-protein ligase ATL42-like [Cornus florida]